MQPSVGVRKVMYIDCTVPLISENPQLAASNIVSPAKVMSALLLPVSVVMVTVAVKGCALVDFRQSVRYL